MYIYAITNIENKKVYTGSTICKLKKRWQEHRSMLRNNKHHSRHLQNSWNKYGESSFVISILEKIQRKENMLEREQYWLDFYKSWDINIGYNISKSAYAPMVERNHTEEAKRKISKHFSGRKLTKEHKKKIGLASSKNQLGENNHISKLTTESVREIRRKYKPHKYSQQRLAKEYGVSKTAIQQVVENRSWMHIGDK